MIEDKVKDIKDLEPAELISEQDAISKTDTWLTQKIFNVVSEEVYQRGTFTVHVIHASAGGKEWEGVGFSKAHPQITITQYDPEKGQQVARGRAIYDLFTEFKKGK